MDVEKYNKAAEKVRSWVSSEMNRREVDAAQRQAQEKNGNVIHLPRYGDLIDTLLDWPIVIRLPAITTPTDPDPTLKWPKPQKLKGSSRSTHAQTITMGTPYGQHAAPSRPEIHAPGQLPGGER
jgi:hypothetical protein